MFNNDSGEGSNAEDGIWTWSRRRERHARGSDGSRNPNSPNGDDQNVDNMRVQTMYKMVEDIELVVSGCSFQKKVLYLTNKQCSMFKRESIQRCLQALDLGKPKCIIRLLPAVGGVADYEAHTEKQGFLHAAQRHGNDINAHDAQRVRAQLDLFMKECILPLAARNRALIICSGSNDDEFSASLERVAVPQQTRLGVNCPFKILSFARSYEVHQSARKGKGIAGKISQRCEAWRRGFKVIDAYVEECCAIETQQCDLVNAATHLVVFEGLGEGHDHSDAPPAFQAKLLDAMTSQLPSIAVQMLKCDYATAADLSNRDVPILFLDCRERDRRSLMKSMKLFGPGGKDPVPQAPEDEPAREYSAAQAEASLAEWVPLLAADLLTFFGNQQPAAQAPPPVAAVPPAGQVTSAQGAAGPPPAPEAPGLDPGAHAPTTTAAAGGAHAAGPLPSSPVPGGRVRAPPAALDGQEVPRATITDLARAVEEELRNTARDQPLDMLDAACGVILAQVDVMARAGASDFDNASSIAFIHAALKWGCKESVSKTPHVPLHQRIQELKAAEEKLQSDVPTPLFKDQPLREAADFLNTTLPTKVRCAMLTVAEERERRYAGNDPDWKGSAAGFIGSLRLECDDIGRNDLHIRQLLSSPLTFSGSIFDLEDISRTISSVVKIDRLPKNNSMEALLSLQDAWDHVDAYHQYASFYKSVTKISYGLLLLGGFLTCLIAILRVNGVLPGRSGQYASLAVSLASGLVASYVSFMNPAQLWQQLRGGAVSMESQIWMFRTRAGEYRSPFESDMDSSHADTLLQERIFAIKKEVLESGYIKRTAFLGKFLKRNLRNQHDPEVVQKTWWWRYIAGPCWAAVCCACLRFCRSPDTEARESVRESFNTINSRGTTWSNAVQPESSTMAPVADPLEREESSSKFVDSHYLPVQPGEYVVFRMQKELKFYKKRIPLCNRTRHIGQLLSSVCSIASVVLAFLNLVDWTVLTAVGVAAVFSWVEFEDTINKLERYSSVVDALQNHLIWWKTRQSIEHCSLENIDHLVIKTEEILMNELAAWRFSSTTSRKLLESKVSERQNHASDRRTGGAPEEVP